MCDEDAAPAPLVQGVNTKFFVLAQYTRHVRPGMVILATNSSDALAAYDRDARKLVVVSVVFSEARWVTTDLSAFAAVAGPVVTWTTNTDGAERHAEDYPGHRVVPFVDPETRSFSVYRSANSIQTYEVSGVDL